MPSINPINFPNNPEIISSFVIPISNTKSIIFSAASDRSQVACKMYNINTNTNSISEITVPSYITDISGAYYHETSNTLYVYSSQGASAYLYKVNVDTFSFTQVLSVGTSESYKMYVYKLNNQTILCLGGSIVTADLSEIPKVTSVYVIETSTRYYLYNISNLQNFRDSFNRRWMYVDFANFVTTTNKIGSICWATGWNNELYNFAVTTLTNTEGYYNYTTITKYGELIFDSDSISLTSNTIFTVNGIPYTIAPMVNNTTFYLLIINRNTGTIANVMPYTFSNKPKSTYYDNITKKLFVILENSTSNYHVYSINLVEGVGFDLNTPTLVFNINTTSSSMRRIPRMSRQKNGKLYLVIDKLYECTMESGLSKIYYRKNGSTYSCNRYSTIAEMEGNPYIVTKKGTEIGYSAIATSGADLSDIRIRKNSVIYRLKTQNLQNEISYNFGGSNSENGIVYNPNTNVYKYVRIYLETYIVLSMMMEEYADISVSEYNTIATGRYWSAQMYPWDEYNRIYDSDIIATLTGTRYNWSSNVNDYGGSGQCYAKGTITFYINPPYYPPPVLGTPQLTAPPNTITIPVTAGGNVNIYRSNSLNGTYTLVANNVASGNVVLTNQPNGLYYYKATSIGSSTYSNIVSINISFKTSCYAYADQYYSASDYFVAYKNGVVNYELEVAYGQDQSASIWLNGKEMDRIYNQSYGQPYIVYGSINVLTGDTITVDVYNNDGSWDYMPYARAEAYLA